MPRTFDGTNDEIRTAIGACNITAAITMAIVARRNSTSYNALIGLHTSGGTATYSIEIEDNGAGNSFDFCGKVDHAMSFVNADGWCILAAGKAAGTSTPRLHKYVYSTDTWTHINGGSTLADQSSVSGGTVRFGEWQDVDDFAGDIAIAGIWNRLLTDAEMELLPFTLQQWYASAPSGLWLFDQSDVGQSLGDLTGGGANQSGTGGAITGTAVGTNNVPLFNVTDGAWLVVRPQGAGGGGTTLTPDAVTVPLVIATPSLALVLPTAAVSIPLTVVTPTRALTLSAAPVTVPLTVVTPTLLLGVQPAPVTIPVQVVTPARALSLAQTPVTIPIIVPTPAATVGGSETLTPDPVAIPIATPTPSLAMTLAVAAVPVPLTVPTPTVSVGGTVVLTPDPVQVPLAIAAPTIRLALAPAPVASPVVVVTPTLVLGFVLQPAAVGIPIQVAALSLALVARPDPVTVLLLVPSPTIPGMVVLGPGTVHGGPQRVGGAGAGAELVGGVGVGSQLIGSVHGGPDQ